MKNALLISIIVIGLAAAATVARVIDQRNAAAPPQFSEEPLYVSGATARRLSLGFNGLAADWYWMRSLQYVGRKIIAREDQSDGAIDLSTMSSLDLRLLPQLLRVSAALDPQFMAPYEYGAVLLPEVSSDDAIGLLNDGIAANPTSWKLYQHLGYVYWQRHDYRKASEVYLTGATMPDAPAWMTAIAARMKAEGGSPDAARDIYQHLAESSSDEGVKDMVEKQIMRLDWLDEREKIRKLLSDYRAGMGHCLRTWKEISPTLRAWGLRVDASGAPLDPSATPYRLIKDGCDVDLNENTSVPKR